MIKLIDLLYEASFNTYNAMVKVVYGENSDANEVAELFRALPGVTTCTLASQDADTRTANLKVKLITQKDSSEAFGAMKTNAMDKYPMLDAVEVADNTIEEK